MSAPTILVLNGPNLGRLGTRSPEMYGSTTLQQLEEMLRDRAIGLGVRVECFQSDDENGLVGVLRGTPAAAAILNPASLTHHSFALRDAVAGCGFPVYEVHISNIYRREPYRRHSLISGVARASIVGCGVQGYLFALEAAAREATQR